MNTLSNSEKGFLSGQYICLFPCPQLARETASEGMDVGFPTSTNTFNVNVNANKCDNTMSALQIGIFKKIILSNGATDVLFAIKDPQLTNAGSASPPPQPPQGAAELLAVLNSLRRRGRRRLVIVTESKSVLPVLSLLAIVKRSNKRVSAVTVLRLLLTHLEEQRFLYFQRHVVASAEREKQIGYATDRATATTIASDEELAEFESVVHVVGHEWLSLCASRNTLVPIPSSTLSSSSVATGPAESFVYLFPKQEEKQAVVCDRPARQRPPESTPISSLSLLTIPSVNAIKKPVGTDCDNHSRTTQALNANVKSHSASACNLFQPLPPFGGVTASTGRLNDNEGKISPINAWGNVWPPQPASDSNKNASASSAGYHDDLPRSTFRDFAIRSLVTEKSRAAAVSKMGVEDEKWAWRDRTSHEHVNINGPPSYSPQKERVRNVISTTMPLYVPEARRSVITASSVSNTDVQRGQCVLVENKGVDDIVSDRSHIAAFMDSEVVAPMNRKNCPSGGEKGGFISIFFGHQGAHNEVKKDEQLAVGKATTGRILTTHPEEHVEPNYVDNDDMTCLLSGGFDCLPHDEGTNLWAPFVDDVHATSAESGGPKIRVQADADSVVPCGNRRLHEVPIVSPFVSGNARMMRQLEYVDKVKPFAIQQQAARTSSLVSRDDTITGVGLVISKPSDREAKESLAAPNQALLDELAALKEVYASTGDHWRSYAYNRAIGVIKRYKGVIKTGEEVRNCIGIGEKLYLKIKEILATGTSSKLARLKASSEVKAIEAFTRVWGIGPSTAKRIANVRGTRWDDTKAFCDVAAKAEGEDGSSPHSNARCGENTKHEADVNPYMRFITTRTNTKSSGAENSNVKCVVGGRKLEVGQKNDLLYTSIEDLRMAPPSFLTTSQRVGLKYLEDLEVRIPRAEVDFIVATVVAALERLGFAVNRNETDKRLMGASASTPPPVSAEGTNDSQRVASFQDLGSSSRRRSRHPLDVVVCGSYRRGKPSSGDVDILICDRSGKRTDGILRMLTEELRRADRSSSLDLLRGSDEGGVDLKRAASANAFADHVMLKEEASKHATSHGSVHDRTASTTHHHQRRQQPFLLAELTTSYKSQRESSCDTWFGVVQVPDCCSDGMLKLPSSQAHGETRVPCPCTHRTADHIVAFPTAAHSNTVVTALGGETCAAARRYGSSLGVQKRVGMKRDRDDDSDDELADDNKGVIRAERDDQTSPSSLALHHRYPPYTKAQQQDSVSIRGVERSYDEPPFSVAGLSYKSYHFVGHDGSSDEDADVTILSNSSREKHCVAKSEAKICPKVEEEKHHIVVERQATHHQPFGMADSGPILRYGEGVHIARRLDIKVYPADQFPFAVLYFTGSDYFNRSMRLYCHRRGLSLSDHGLLHVIRHRREAIHEGASVPCYSERDIFDAIGLPYRMPHERDL